MKKTDYKLPPIAILAEAAFKEAVAEVIEDHRRRGDPIAVWRNGKVVLLPADQLPVQKSNVVKSMQSRSVEAGTD